MKAAHVTHNHQSISLKVRLHVTELTLKKVEGREGRFCMGLYCSWLNIHLYLGITVKYFAQSAAVGLLA